jgi:hypothetical protein
MELELLNTLTHMKDTALAILILMPAIGLGLFLLKEAFGLDRWRF